MTRHAEVAASAIVRRAIPALARLASLIGDAQVRNRGTLGGSVANSDPSADYPAAVIALGATIRTDRREIAADDYFKDLFETALEPGEMIRAIRFPDSEAEPPIASSPIPASRYAVVGVFVAQFADGVRVGVTGAGPCAFRARTIEDALAAAAPRPPSTARRSTTAASTADLHASAEYRGALVRVMAKRAVQALLG